jgi:hypothetical protein
MSRSDFDVVTGPAPSRPIAPAAGPAKPPARNEDPPQTVRPSAPPASGTRPAAGAG